MNHNSKFNDLIPENGFLRLAQIIGNPKAGIAPIFPVSRTTWYQGVKIGKYPKPYKLSERCSAYLRSDIIELLNKLKGGE